MKIAYVVNARIPTEKAHGYQIMRTCSEWKKAGVDVTLYVPVRSNHIDEDAFSFYGLEKTFKVEYLECKEWVKHSKLLGAFAFYLQSRSFLRALWRSNMVEPSSIIYTRDAQAVSFFSGRGFSCIYNAHNWPARDFLIKRLLRGAKGIVCNSKGTEEAVKKAFSGKSGKPTIVVHNAADQNLFAGKPTGGLRTELGLPADEKVVTYVGHLYGWKGTDIVIPLARSFTADSKVTFQVIGGTPADLEKFSGRLKESRVGNISLLGFKKKELIPKYLATSDALLLPNNASSEESLRYTSPIKLFEYMASGVPIVASDLPSIRDILPYDAGFFAEPGSVADFHAAVAEAFSATDGAREKAARALAESKKYSWASQAGRALEFIKGL